MRRRLQYPAAAEELGIEESWLRRHIKRLPHTKLGRTVYFTDADLERIDALFHHEPSTGPLAAVVASAPISGSHPLSNLRPLPGRSRHLART
ncbi:DNA-binding protein [Streptomyces sp. NPDC046909]|uniref:DNA-binding protein n=1 Tax=Streptomyces sp. NPDC046909 TaxID=3155617 RepID=UPI0033FFC498